MTMRLGRSSSLAGCLALAGSLAWALLARGRETRELVEEAGSLRAESTRLQDAKRALEGEVESWRQRLDAARLEASRVDSEVRSLLLSDPRLIADEASVLEELNGRIAGLEAEIETAGRSRAAEVQPVSPPPARPQKPTATTVSGPAIPPAELERHLKGFQESIVLVVSSGPRLATGLIVGQRADRVHVLTVSDAVAPGADATCLFRGSTTEEGEFLAAPCEVVHRETPDPGNRSPFLVLEATVPGSATFRPLLESHFERNLPAKGDAVYAVGAHAVGSTAFTGSVFEGIVSSVEETSAGGHRLVRTTLPANEGAPGSLVLTAGGKVAGVLWKRAGNLDRVSTVVSAGSAKPVLERIMRHTLATAAGDRTEPAHESIESSIDLEEPLSPEAEVFGGPDDLAIVWDAPGGTLRAYRSGKTSPVWEIRRGPWSSLTYRPWQPHAFLTSVKNRVGVVLNLRSGKSAGRLSDQLTFSMSRAWAALPVGTSHVLAFPKGFAIANLESGRVIEARPVKGTLMAHVGDIITLSTEKGEVGWLTRSEFLTVLARMEALYKEIADLHRSKMSEHTRAMEINNRHTQIQALFQHLARGIKIFTVPGGLGRDPLRPGSSFCHVPGSYLHLIGRNVWQIGPDQVVRRGSLERLWHSAGGEDPSRVGQPAGPQPCAMASPDGRHAVTSTHLHDPHLLQAVAELPFPAGPVGFLSKGEKLYAHDRKHKRLVFLRLAELLGGDAR
jgi:hypothetical protein